MMMLATAGSLCRTYAIPYLQDKLMFGEGCGLLEAYATVQHCLQEPLSSLV